MQESIVRKAPVGAFRYLYRCKGKFETELIFFYAVCPAKLEAGLLGLQMQKNGKQFYGGDGLVEKGVENTIRNIGELAKKGMRETDKTIIQIMTS